MVDLRLLPGGRRSFGVEKDRDCRRVDAPSRLVGMGDEWGGDTRKADATAPLTKKRLFGRVFTSPIELGVPLATFPSLEGACVESGR